MKNKKGITFIILLTVITTLLFSEAYYSYVSKIMFNESSTHLTEIYSQVGKSLSNLLTDNWSAMKMWIPYFNDADSDENIRNYIYNIRATSAFTDFYFLSENGSYCTIDGNKGNMDLGRNMKKLMYDKMNVVSDTALIDRSELVVFAIPCPQGRYMDFSYSAIAISFNNKDIISLLSAQTFDGQAVNYVIYPDGRVVVNNRGEHGDEINNFWRMLTENSQLDNETIRQYRTDICYNGSGVDTIMMNGVLYYVTYELIGFKDWILIGIVPAGVVNENLNELQTVTITACVSLVAFISLLSILYLICKNYISIRIKDSEIKYREELFSVLSNNVDDIFLMLDQDCFSVGYVSPNIERLLGIAPRDAISDICVIECVLEESRFAIRRRFNDMSEDERIEWDSIYKHQQSGERKWFHITALCRTIGGQKKYILVLSDRTKERSINQALKNAVNEAERANKAKSTFLSNISHDIRTPLSAILSFAMLAGNESGNTELTNDYLSKIMISGNYLLGLISDILDMSRIESGKLTFNNSNVDISEVLYNIRTVINTQAAEKKQNLYVSMRGVVHENVYCDQYRLEQLFTNLLSNAVKFTQDGGDISLTVIEKTGDIPNIPTYEIRVKDNGLGMSEAFVEKIFEPFERERKVAGNIQGTGLGMPITKNIVEAVGGTITIDTKQGVGTEFIVTLPLSISKKKDIPAFIGFTALIVITDNNIAENAASALNKLGISCDIYDGQLKRRNDKRYDIILSDCYRASDAQKYITKNKLDDTLLIVATDNTMCMNTPDNTSYIGKICSVPFLTYELKKIIEDHSNCKTAEADSNGTDADILGSKRILLAEDVDVNCRIVKAMLSSYRVEIDTAENGIEALDMIKSHGEYYYDCVLMDILMPIMDGYECSRAIRQIKNDYASKIPIIAMTANIFSDDREKAARCGMNAFLTKPVNTKQLVETLIRVLSE